MKATSRLTLAGLATLLFVTASCRSSRTPAVYLPPEPGGREQSPKEQIALVSADSLVFDAVVRAQVPGNDDEYPRRLPRLRYDSRPYGTASGYPVDFKGVQGIDPTLSFGRASQSVIDRVAENRARILEKQGVENGGPVVYPQCAGARVPTPPPPRRTASSARPKGRDVHAGCPPRPEYYLTVGLPIRGQPEGLKDLPDVHGNRVSPRGEVWTVLVDEHLVGPTGWTWSQYAWLIKRNRSGRLELDSAILIGVIE